MARWKDSKWDSYACYLASDEWAGIRQQVFERDDNQCQLCGVQAEHAHHHKYPKNWAYDSADNCIAICQDCHEHVHGRAKFVKRESVDTERIYEVVNANNHTINDIHSMVCDIHKRQLVIAAYLVKVFSK